MKRTKRVLSLALAAVILGSALTGCGSSSSASSAAPAASATASTAQDGKKDFANKNLNIAVFQGGYGADYWEEVIAKFEAAYPGVKVNMTINPKIGDIIRPQIVAGNVPDFLSLSDGETSGLILSMIKEKALMDITDVFNEKALDKDQTLKDMILPGFLSSTKYAPYNDGKIYLAPFNAGATGLVYNKTLFKEKGWKVPETWDEFFALQKELDKPENYLVNADGTKTKRALFTYQGIYPSYLEEILWPAIASTAGLGAADKIASYTEGSFKNADVKKVLDMFAKIGKEGYLMSGTVALNHTQSQADMMMGKSLFIVNGNWMENEMKDSPREKGFEFGMIPAPTFNKDDQKYVYTSYEQFSIPAKAKNPELAKEFLKFLYTDDSVRLFAEKANGVYALKGAQNLVQDILTSNGTKPSFVYDSFGILNSATSMMMNWESLPKGTKVNVSDEIFTKCMTPIMNGSMTTDQWMDNVENAFKQARSDVAADK